MNARAYLAELLGTFMFMMVGYTSFAAISLAAPATTGIVVVPFAFGLGLLAAIFAFGHISGGHYNPAVTMAMVLDKRTTAVEAVGYIIAQIIGAIAAGVVIYVIVNQDAVAAGITKPGAGVSDISALILEIIFTAIFLLVILIASNRAGLAGPGHPLHAGRHPLRHRDAHRLVGQPRAVDRLGDRRGDLTSCGSTSSARSSAGSSAGASIAGMKPGGPGPDLAQVEDRSRLEILEAEPPGIAHLGPDAGLGHAQHLTDVVAVVVDPFAEKLVDA